MRKTENVGQRFETWLQRQRIAVCLVALFSFGWAGVAQAEGQGPAPNPALGPAEVVRIQLEALRGNDASDQGIAVCFRFASPSNRRMTGPASRFGNMIKQGQYALMLSYLDAKFEPVEIRERRALQVVTLTGTTQSITYAFWLTRQSEGECEDCWMTDAVLVEKVDNVT